MLDTELKTALDSITGETKAAFTDLKAKYDALETQHKELQRQTDAIDAKSQQRHVASVGTKSLGQLITESPEYAAAKESGFMGGRKSISIALKSGAFPLERKTDITETALGAGTSGVLMPQRIPGVAGMARQALRIRDVMNVIPQALGNSFDYVYQDTRTNATSPQVEGSAKAQGYLKWSSAIGSIRPLAEYVRVSRQALDDLPWMRNTIDSELIYALKVKEEAEILSGDGSGIHLNGIINQATAFDTTLMIAADGWQRLDVLRYAKLQVRLAGLATYAPSAFILNPTDLAKLELTKDSYGHYIIGDPRTGVEVNMIWNLPVVESDSIVAGTFLVGAFDTAADLIDRMSVTVEISFEDADNFTRNMATILCEERVGLAVKVATAFVHGSFSTSPM